MVRRQAARCAACGEQGYAKANNTRDGLDTLKWGTDYLLRTLAKTSKSGAKIPEYNIAYQVIPSPSDPCHGVPFRDAFIHASLALS